MPRSPLLVAVFQPLHLVLLALTVAAGLCSTWWLFPVGLLLWGGLVWAASRSPAVQTLVNVQARAGALTPRFQGLYDEVSRGQVRLMNALGDGQNLAQEAALAPVQQALNELADEVFSVCQRMTAPENYLRVSNLVGLEQERALAVLAVESTQDPAQKGQRQDALNALLQRIESLKAIETLLNRTEAQLKTAGNELGVVLSEVMRLQAIGAQADAQTALTLAARLRQQTHELRELERQA
ncbi:MAG TPA: hypothetical protein PK954_05705 [Anaerolineales bacterium]|nr:hypothetical protein [Anaerolineales bacterium]HRF48602.1 hypothetical protein [Anaerolineales bacterium]